MDIHSEMFPILNDGWVIRGTKEKPRLFHLMRNDVIPIPIELINYIIDCNGQYSFKEIQKRNEKYSLNQVLSFYEKFLKEGVITQSPKPTPIQIDIGLGDHEPWLKEVHIDITSNCNLRCRHCFWGENLTSEKEVPIDHWVNFISNLKDKGVAKIVISGGEAFTSKNVYKLVEAAYCSHLMVSALFTNGTILNDDVKKVVQYLSQKKMTTAFYISLDGRSPFEHDFIRGKDNFQKTCTFIQYLVDYKKQHHAHYHILVNSLIHKRNCTDLISWYNFLESLGVEGWRFTTGRISGYFVKNEDSIKVSSAECFSEYQKLIRYIINKYNSGEKTLYVNIENFFTTRALRNKKMYIFDDSLPICDYKQYACSVDPNGNVQFCTGWQSIKYGNVFETDIQRIWHESSLSKLKQMKIRDITGCQGCRYLKYCGGGCRLECDNIYEKDKSICQNFELFEEYIIPLLKQNQIELSIS